MKQLKHLLLLPLIILGSYVNAQEKIDLHIYRSKIEVVKKYTFLDAISMPNGDVIVYDYIKKTGGRIRHFDKNFKLISKKNIKEDKPMFYSSFKGMFVKDGELNIIFSNNYKNRLEYKVVYGSLKNLDLTHKKTFLTIEGKEFSKLLINTLFAKRRYRAFSASDLDMLGYFTFSDNNKFMAISFGVEDKKREKHLLYVYDNNFNKIYKKEITRNHKDKLYIVENLIVSDIDGAVYLLSTAFKKKTRYTKNNYYQEILKFTKDNVQEIKIEHEGKFIRYAKIAIKDNMLFFTGLYGNKNVSKTRGVFRYNIDLTNFEINKKVFSPFRDKIYLEKFIKIRKGKEKNREINNLELKYVFVDKDYNIYLNMEEIKFSSVGSSSMKEFKDIVAVKIDLEGNYLWEKNINKMQYVSTTIAYNSGLYSYYSVVVNSKNYFFVNLKQVKKSKKDVLFLKAKKPASLGLYAFMIDQNGVLSYEKVKENKNFKGKYKIEEERFLKNAKAVLFIGRKGKKIQLLETKLNF